MTDGSKAKKTGQIHDDVGIREIKMPVPLLAIVRAATVPSRHEKDDPWVFTTVTGLPLQPGVRIRRRWAAIVKRTGLPTDKGAPTFYTLKHVGKSWALSNGVSPDAKRTRWGRRGALWPPATIGRSSRLKSNGKRTF